MPMLPIIDNRHQLFSLRQDGAVIYSKEQLAAKGFAPTQDGFYLCYKIASAKPVVVSNINYKSLIKRGKATNVPHIEIVERGRNKSAN